MAHARYFAWAIKFWKKSRTFEAQITKTKQKL